MLHARPHSTVSPSTRYAVLGISAGLFAISLFLPALEFQNIQHPARDQAQALLHPLLIPNSYDVWNGGRALWYGLFGLLGGGELAGYANPFLWIAWIYLALDRLRSACRCALVAAALSLLTFRLYNIPITVDPTDARYELLIHTHSGAWLWFASLLLPLVASALWWNRQSTPTAPAPPYPSPPPAPAPPPGANLRY